MTYLTAAQHDSVLKARDEILDALREEMRYRHRDNRWEVRERLAVVYAANKYAREHIRCERTNAAQVEAIEGLAVGHVDYASKLALYVAELIHGLRPVA